ncbi:unnamed protein product [Choristocarpus tenellus]
MGGTHVQGGKAWEKGLTHLSVRSGVHGETLNDSVKPEGAGLFMFEVPRDAPDKLYLFSKDYSTVGSRVELEISDEVVNTDLRVFSLYGSSCNPGSVKFRYTDVAIHDVEPPHGPLTGGTTVLISGQGFENNTLVACQFGPVTQVKAQFTSPSHITCISPGLPVTGPVIVEVTVNGIDFSTSGKLFSYTLQPAVLSVQPMSGPAIGGTSVFISGTNFIDSEELGCRFGSSLVPGRWLSDVLVQCTSPSQTEHHDHTVEVEVSTNGVDFTSNYVNFWFHDAQVSVIFPSLGYTTGGTQVSLRGQGFVFSAELMVQFGQVRVPAIFISTSELKCISPSVGTAGVVKVLISTNGMDFHVAPGVVFDYVDPPDVDKLEPSWSVIGTESWVPYFTITGKGFINTTDLACRFDNQYVLKAVFHSSVDIKCQAPEQLIAGKTSVELTMNGVDFTSTGLHVTFVDPPIVFFGAPSSGPVEGGTIVHVNGANFADSNGFQCLFDTKTVMGHWQSSTSLHCVSPRGDQHEVAFGVLFHGNVLPSESKQFTYYDEPSVTELFPWWGPIEGGTNVSIHGKSFLPSRDLKVKFGGTIVPATFFSESELHEGERYLGMSATVNIAYFGFTSQPYLLDLNPSSGFNSGGTTVLLTGKNLVDSDRLQCHFGRLSVPGLWLSTTSIQCQAPPSNRNGTVSVEVSSSVMELTSSGLSFRYLVDPTVDSIMPTSGSNWGRTPIVIHGKGFAFSSGLMAYFGGIAVPVTFINPSELFCISPPGPSGVVRVAVGNNDQEFTALTENTFEYQERATVSSLEPHFGSHLGGNVVSVYGEHFVNSSSLACAFGDVGLALTRFVSDTEVECISPSSTMLGSVVVEVTLNGIDFTSDGVPFIITGVSSVLSASPNTGPSIGGTIVLVHGVNFVESRSLECLFGSLHSRGHWISSSLIHCLSPVGDQDSSIPLRVAHNRSRVSTGYAMFSYYAHPVVTSVSPALGPAEGGNLVSIYGTGFWFSGDIRARFGFKDAPVTYISPSELRCNVPHSSLGIVTLSLSFNGVDYGISGNITYKFITQPKVYAISPILTSPFVRKGVTVHGTGFKGTTSLWCTFGSTVTVQAIYVSVTIMQCVTQAHIAGGHVPVMVTMNGSNPITEVINISHTRTPFITSVSPMSGPASEETTVLVNGMDFEDAVGLTCIFGAYSVPAQWMSTYLVQCQAPGGEPGQSVPVQIAVGDETTSSGNAQFTYLAKRLVTGFSPSSGSRAGGTLVEIYGNGITFSNGLRAEFGAMNVPVAFVNSSRLQCTTVPSLAGKVQLTVSLNGEALIQADKMVFTFIDNPRVESLLPVRGSAAGGTLVTILGRGFVNSTSLACKFNGYEPVPAHYRSPEEVTCTSPGSKVAGLVPLEVTMNGVDFTQDGVLFKYDEISFILSAIPDIGPVVGGTSIRVYGGHFIDTEELQCRFGGSHVPGFWVSPELVICTSPLLAGRHISVQHVSLGITFNTQDFVDSDAGFSYHPGAGVLSNVFPQSGPTVGGFPIFLFGTGFSFSGNIKAWFGQTEVPVRYVDASELVCTVPGSVSHGTVNVTLRIDDILVPSLDTTSFHYVGMIVVNSVEPSHGSISGGATITVYGTGFVNTTQLTCRIGEVKAVMTKFVSETEISCTVPQYKNGGHVPVAIALNGLNYSTSDSAIFHYVQDPDGVNVTPSSGPITGGTVVTVSGIHFLESDTPACQFGSTMVPAVWVSAGVIQCESPSWDDEVYGASLQILFNGVQAILGSMVFQYKAVSIQSMVPTKGSELGGTPITIVGSGFEEDICWYCWFGLQHVPALLISYHSLNCIAPGRSTVETEVDVKVSSGNAHPIIKMPVQLQYVPAVNALVLWPIGGSVLGGTSLVVQFQQNSRLAGLPLHCKFSGAGWVVAKWLNNSSVECLTPAHSSTGQAFVSVSAEDPEVSTAQHSTALLFQFYKTPEIIKMYPLWGSITEGRSFSLAVTITGANFEGSSQLSCRFGNVVFTARWISPSVIKCPLPSMPPGDYDVSVSNNMADFVDSGLVFHLYFTSFLPYANSQDGNGAVRPSPIVGSTGFDIGRNWMGLKNINSTYTMHESHVGDDSGLTPQSGMESHLLPSLSQSRPYSPPILVHQVSPSTVLSQGGSRVLVYGAGFNNFINSTQSTGLWCFFGEEQTHAFLVSAVQVLCFAPPHAPGEVVLQIGSSPHHRSVNGVQIYYDDGYSATTHIISPQAGPLEGGTMISIVGTGSANFWGSDSNVMCQFGRKQSAPAHISKSEVMCMSPPGVISGDVNLTLSVFGQDVNLGSFEYYDLVKFDLVHPSVVDVKGDTTIIFSAKPESLQMGTDIGSLFCKIGGKVLAAKVHLDSAVVHCLVPAHPPGQARVTLWNGNHKVIVGDAIITFHPTPVITKISPSVGFSSGGSMITVYGHFFLGVKDLKCFFGRSVAVEVAWIAPTQVQCMSPPNILHGDMYITVSNNGITYSDASETSKYRVFQDPDVTEVVPGVGSTMGTSVVRLFGQHFPQFSQLECLFGSLAVPASILSPNIVECIITSQTHSEVTVGIQIRTGSTIVAPRGMQGKFSYSSSIPTTVNIWPHIGSIDGNSTVHVRGSGFSQKEKLQCQFQGNRVVKYVLAKWISSALVICISPPWAQPEEGVTVDITVEGIAMDNTGEEDMKFSFRPTPTVTSLIPDSGPEHGGVEIRVIGTNFQDTASLACLFCRINQQCERSPGRWSSERDMWCIAPKQMPGVVTVEVTVNGLDYSISGVPYVIMPMVHIIDISPPSGSTTGGTQVSVLGNNFVFVPGISCRFGLELSPAAYHGPNHITCVSPANLHSSSVSVEVYANGIDLTSDGYTFQYLPAAAVPFSISIDPSFGDSRGGTAIAVDVSGAREFFNELDHITWSCSFGNVSTPLVKKHTSIYLCKTPAFANDGVLDLHVYGIHDSTVSLPTPFTVLPAIELFSINPTTGTEAGGQDIIIAGKGFKDSPLICCRFGDLSTGAIFLSPSSVKCTTPPSTIGLSRLLLEVSNNCIDFYGNGLEFHYKHTIYFGPQCFGTQSNSEQCQQTWLGGVNHMCDSAKFSLSLEAYNEGCLPYEGEFIPPDVGGEISATPLSGPLEGGTWILFGGFEPESQLDSCLFTSESGRDVTVPALVTPKSRNYSCISPQWPSPGPSQLSILGNGTEIAARFTFTFYMQPQLIGIHPRLGDWRGGTRLSLEGVRFPSSSSLTCRFTGVTDGNRAHTAARWISDYETSCYTPVLLPGKTNVTLSVNGVDYVEGSNIVFQAMPTATAHSITPTMGGLAGGTEVVVAGASFFFTSEAICRFGNVSVGATIVDTHHAVCVTPPLLNGHGASNDVSFTMYFNGKNAVPVGSHMPTFRYIPTPLVTGITPKSGPLSGGTLITVTGFDFIDAGEGITCRFGQEVVLATRRSPNKLVCQSPPHVGGSVLLTVTNGVLEYPPGEQEIPTFSYVPSILPLHGEVNAVNNTKQFMERTIQIPFLGSISIDSISPDNGPNTGGTSVTVIGRNFILDNTMECHFGTKTTTAAVMSSKLLFCSSPPPTLTGRVNFSLSSISQKVLNSTPFHFSYIDRPVVVEVSPSLGHSGSVLNTTISGFGFINTSFLACRLGAGPLMKAKFLSTKTVLCELTTEVPGYMHVDVTNNGIDFGTPGNMEFVLPPVITGMTPSLGSEQGGMEVTVAGLRFKDVPELACRFGERVVLARWLSSGTIQCIVPPSDLPQSKIVAVTLNQQQYSSQMIQFEYVPKTDIALHLSTPSIGMTRGGALVTIHGTNFVRSANAICRFGHAGDVMAQILNDTALQCITPPSTEGTVGIQVSMNGKYFTTTHASFTFIHGEVHTLHPNQGPVAGGTVVAVSGSGFSCSRVMACSFGNNPSSLVTCLSPTEIRCTAPPTSVPSLLPVTVSIDGIVLESVNGSPFRYLLSPKVTGLTPQAIASNEPAWVTVFGENFYDDPNLGCLFNGEYGLSTRWMSMDMLQCQAPIGLTLKSNPVLVTVTTNGVDLSDSVTIIEIRQRLSIVEVTPPHGNVFGGTPVKVILSGQAPDVREVLSSGDTQCMFGDVPVPGNTIRLPTEECLLDPANHMQLCNAVLCTAPPRNDADVVHVRVLAYGTTTPDESATYSYSNDIPISMKPSSGEFAGGTKVFLGFGHISEGNVTRTKSVHSSAICRFAEGGIYADVVAEVLVNPKRVIGVICQSPEWQSSREQVQASVKISINGTSFIPTGLSFTYYSVGSVVTLNPERGNEVGGTKLHIHGIGFRPSGNISCTFVALNLDHKEIMNKRVATSSARWISEQEVVCDTPPHHPGTVQVGLKVGSTSIPGLVEFTYESQVQVTMLLPPKGCTSGGTPVRVRGNNFHLTGQISCIFGSAEVPAAFVDIHTILCTSPPAPVGSLPVSIRMDGNIFSDPGPLFEYLPGIQVTDIDPIMGWTTGGAAITLKVKNIELYALHYQLLCSFGGYEQVPLLVDGPNMVVICSSPPLEKVSILSGRTATLVSLVGENGIDVGASASEFLYLVPSTVISVEPSYGSERGGTSVLISGENFSNIVGLECQFGAFIVPAKYISSQAVTCSTPMRMPGQVSATIVFGGVLHAFHTSANFTFSASVHVNSASLGLGDQNGEIVTVHGHGFWPSPGLICRFGEYNVIGTFINETAIQCPPPASQDHVVVLSVAMDGTNFSPTGVPFMYSKKALNVSLTPHEGTVYGGTVLTARGLDLADRLSLECVFTSEFGEVTAQVTQVSSDTFKCITPTSPGLRTGKVTLELINTISPTSTVTDFEFMYIDPPSIVSVLPSRGFQSGGTKVYVSGQSYMSSEALTCRFTDPLTGTVAISAAQFLSSSSLTCITPEWISGSLEELTVLLDITINGVDYTSSGLTFSYLPLAVISFISPAQGSLNGGTVVAIFGSSLQQNMRCLFGSRSVAARTVSHTQLFCVSPPAIRHQEGEVKLSLTLNDQVVDGPDATFTYQNYYNPATSSGNVTAWGVTSTSIAPVPVISHFQPNGAPSSGGSTITLTGERFVSSRASTCSFGGVLVQALMVTRNTMQCVTPRHVPATVLFEVSNDGVEFSRGGMEFTFHHDISIREISPLHGPAEGSTMVTIHGDHFINSSSLACQFGDIVVPGVYQTSTEVVCWSPQQEGSITVVYVEVTSNGVSFSTSLATFTYDSRMEILVLSPTQGPSRGGSEVLLTGINFLNTPAATCKFGTEVVMARYLSHNELLCVAPPSKAGVVPVEVSANGADYTLSGVEYTYHPPVAVTSVWPLMGPASRGGTVVTVSGTGFNESSELTCKFGEVSATAVTWISPSTILCKTPKHPPGLVSVDVTNNGVDYSMNSIQFLYIKDPSVDGLQPTEVLETGQVPVFVTGSNFVNTSALACRFGGVSVKGVFVMSTVALCMAPSHSAQPRLWSNLGSFSLEVTVNGIDHTNNGKTIKYIRGHRAGTFSPHLLPISCPSGTFCSEIGTSNFTLCKPGGFQPSLGAVQCLPCPVGYMYFGLTTPIICTAGSVCHETGLRQPASQCPKGHFCPHGVKTQHAVGISNSSDSLHWIEILETGAAFANTSSWTSRWIYHSRDRPATGSVRFEHPPTTLVLAEQPITCPLGYYCGQGVSSSVPLPKNFSTPQRCFDGFFCPRGSSTPEGSGPCPTGYFCPTPFAAVACPQGQYCPGVANTKPRECSPGSYNMQVAQSNCTLCDTGHICPGWGTIYPELCPAGFVCVAQGLSAPILLCPPGYYCQEGTYTLNPADPTDKRPLPCPAGTFCLGGVAHNLTINWVSSIPEGISAPQICTEGTYCEQASVSPSGSGQCYRGHYCPPGVGYPIETPIGNFASDEGSVVPMLCFPGTYAPLTGANECRVCPAGYTCPSYGTYEPTVCEPGHYRSLSDSVTCRPCPTGTFSSSMGVTDMSFCLPCPPGRICGTQAMVNLTESNVCPAGYNCGCGSDRSNQFSHKCPAGFSCSAGTESKNQYLSVCESGYYCTSGTPNYLATQNKCPVGYYCPDGTTTGSSPDVNCPRKTTSLVGASELLECVIEEVRYSMP